VLIIGVAVVGVAIARGRERLSRTVEVLGVPVLAGLFGLAVALGTLGRAWSGPSAALGHLGAFGTAGAGAAAAVLLNNLPAASLLAAQAPPHPFALLVGLNLGPNLFVTGSLSWFLWAGAARAAGAQPPFRTTIRIGLVAAPLSILAATSVLVLSGAH
jgi:arsenical pump membrane protein